VTELDATANVLGALAQIVGDRTGHAIGDAAGQSTTGAAALSALHHLLDRPTVDAVGRVLGLTPSGAVRLVDRLAAAGLVTRGPGADGRSRAVLLTRKGQRAASRVSAARATVLNGALAGLSTVEREQLGGLLGRVLGALVQAKVATAPGAGGWTCRLCDATACGRPTGACPAANAARAALPDATAP
jgi:DNA-binding MarR family transcriptional regulator